MDGSYLYIVIVIVIWKEPGVPDVDWEILTDRPLSPFPNLLLAVLCESVIRPATTEIQMTIISGGGTTSPQESHSRAVDCHHSSRLEKSLLCQRLI